MRRKSCLLVLLLAMTMTTGCGKSEAAVLTEQYINDIGEISIDSIDAIEKAEKTYESLSEKDKNSVENYAKLITARAEYEDAVKKQEAQLEKEKAAKVEASRADIICNDGTSVRLSSDELRAEADENEVKWKEKYVGAPITFVGTVDDISWETNPKMMGFDETIIRFAEGWELHLNRKQGATTDLKVDGIGKGTVLKVETQIFDVDVFRVYVRGCKSDGSYNAETLMKTQFSEVSQ